MTKILIVSDASGLLGSGTSDSVYRIADPFVTIERIESPADGWADPDYRMTCSADDGTCVRWGLAQTEDQFEDLIANAEKHVELHERGES